MACLDLEGLYAKLRGAYGFRHWWPGETRLEIFVGAILTQNTSWTNVEKAIAGLKSEGALEFEALAGMRRATLERLIRPSRYYRQKAERLGYILSYVKRNYGTLDGFLDRDARALREELLGLKGIGEETADSIVLYAAGKPAFVIDAYTRRIMHRVYGTDEGIKYGELQACITRRIPRRVRLYKDFHAQLVEHAKAHCRKAPACEGCPIRPQCASGCPKKGGGESPIDGRAATFI